MEVPGNIFKSRDTDFTQTEKSGIAKRRQIPCHLIKLTILPTLKNRFMVISIHHGNFYKFNETGYTIIILQKWKIFMDHCIRASACEGKCQKNFIELDDGHTTKTILLKNKWLYFTENVKLILNRFK